MYARLRNSRHYTESDRLEAESRLILPLEILAKARLTGFSQQARGGSEIVKFDENAAIAGLSKVELGVLQINNLPISLARELNQAKLEPLIREIILSTHKDEIALSGDMARQYSHCNNCNSILPQPKTNELTEIEDPPFSGKFKMVRKFADFFCKTCHGNHDGITRKANAKEITLAWQQLAPTAHHAIFDTNSPKLDNAKRGKAREHQNACRKYSEQKLWRQGRWLWLSGETGTGKSHMSNRVLLRAMLDGLSAHIVTSEIWANANKLVIASGDAVSASGEIARCKEAGILAFHDLGKNNEVRQVQALHDLLEYRYANNKPTIINSEGDELWLLRRFGEMGDAIVRRLIEKSQLC